MSNRANRTALHRPKRLTEEGIDKLKAPTERQYETHYNSQVPGLVLRVNSGGTKVWHVLYKTKITNKHGKRVSIATTHKLKRYPILKVKEAREKARLFLADPDKALAQADTGSFKEVAENFVKRYVEKKKLRSQPEIERCLDRYIYPAWEHKPFRELKRGDVAALLDHIEDQHGARQADICLAIVRKMMRWYQSRNDDYLVPVVPDMGRVQPDDRKRKRILDDDEIRALWGACDGMGTFGAIIRVCLLTAQRREKVTTMKWTDLVDGEWRIPSEDNREKSHAGTLRLPPMVLDIITAQPRLANNPYVFAVGGGKGVFNSFSQRKEELDSKLPNMPPWVIHDLRRSARSLMSRAGVSSEHAERVMGHATPGVEGVYDRHSYAVEKADALARLAALVGSIVNPPTGNVLPLAGRRASGTGVPTSI